MTSWAVSCCVNYQRPKRGADGSCMSPMRFRLCRSINKAVVIWEERLLGWEVEGNLKGM